MTSFILNRFAPETLQQPTMGADQRLCRLCEAIEKRILGPHAKETKCPKFDHYQYFEQISTAARLGCQLCRILEQGLLDAQVVYLRTNLPQYAASIHFEFARKFLLYRDNALAGTEEASEQKPRPRYLMTFLRFENLTDYLSDAAMLQGISDFSLHRHFELEGSWEHKAFFMLCVSAEDDAFREGRFCGRELRSRFDSSLAKDWLGTCLSSHSCKISIGDSACVVPTRLIHLLQRVDGLTARLIYPDSNREYEYATLSYRWSDQKDHIMLGRNLETYKKSIPIDVLPATIRDAMRVTIGLGLQYLWVDSLCIVQDSQQDWEEECPRMSSVYANATVTLADASSDISNGFLQNGSPYPFSDACCLKYYDCQGLVKGNVKVRYVRTGGDVNNHTRSNRSLLGTRGWTLQEQLLSSRTLTFEDDKMWWECSAEKIMESRHINRPDPTVFGPIVKYSLMGRTPESIRQWWFSIMEEYSTRDLTFHMDKLPAISGLAKVVQSLTDDDYLAGIWRNDLARSLAWHTKQDRHRADPRLKHVQLPFTGPSWSWSRSDIPAAFFEFEPASVVSSITFLSAKVDVRGQDPFGCVSSHCTLTIRAPCRSVKLSKVRSADTIDECFGYWALGSHNDGSHDPNLRMASDDPFFPRCADEAVEQDSFLAIQIGEFTMNRADYRYSKGLILKSANNEQYRRIGLLHSPYITDLNSQEDTNVGRLFAEAQVLTVSIV